MSAAHDTARQAIADALRKAHDGLPFAPVPPVRAPYRTPGSSGTPLSEPSCAAGPEMDWKTSSAFGAMPFGGVVGLSQI